MTYVCSRRQWLISLIPAVACSRWALAEAGLKPMRGVFIIMATPYTAAKEVDYEDLAREVDFLDRGMVLGLVGPHLASVYPRLTTDERLQGMKILARAAAGKKPALVLGVQGRNTAEALEYLQCAEEASPDAVIAIPPTEAKSLDDFREYYTTLARKTKLPFFVQTTGGAPNIEPTVEFLVELAREFPHCGYVKEEFNPVIDRMKALAAHRPTIKGVFSGQAGRGMMYEMRLGFDGTMPGAPYAGGKSARVVRPAAPDDQPGAANPGYAPVRDAQARCLQDDNVAPARIPLDSRGQKGNRRHVGGAQAVSHRLTIADPRLNYSDADLCGNIWNAVERAQQRHDSARAGAPIHRVAARLVAELHQRPGAYSRKWTCLITSAGERGDAVGCQRTTPYWISAVKSRPCDRPPDPRRAESDRATPKQPAGRRVTRPGPPRNWCALRASAPGPYRP